MTTHVHRSLTRAARILAVVAVPVLILGAPAAWAATGTSWSYTWNPPLDLTIHGGQANFSSLPNNMASRSNQQMVATARFRTNWVDVRAVSDSPNIAQQGLSSDPAQVKLDIKQGPNPAAHRAGCHLHSRAGAVTAYGPSIDVANGAWHTIQCVKYRDTARGTELVVTVDGVAGTPVWSKTRVGDVNPPGPVRLGGRSAVASSDSLDGWLSNLAFSAT